jgi:amino acid transporter
MAGTAPKKVFTRDSTGLVKNVSIVDAITLNLGNMSVGAGLGTIGLTTTLLPAAIVNSGFNLVLTSIIAFLLSVPQIIVYTMMTRRLPRTGGDYVWTSRTLGGFVGSSFSFMGYTLETLAYLALIALSAVFAIGGVGVGLGNSNMLGLSLPANLPGGNALQQFVVAAMIFTILILINIFTPKSGYKLVSALIIVGVVSLAVAILTLLAAGSNGVTNYLNFANTNFAANITQSQVSAPTTASSINWNGVFFMIPFFAIFVYPWLNAAPAVASEMKGKSALRWNVPISAVISLILITGAFGAMYVAGGFSFVSGALTGSLSSFSDFNFWTFAMGATTSLPLQAFIGLGWIVWNIGVLAYGVIVFSRYLFAQSFDRFLPEQLSYISPKYGSPVVAHLIDLVITLGLIGTSAFVYGTLVSLFGNVIAAMVYFIVIGLAASVYALRKEKGISKGILFVAGILMAAVFVYITYLFLANGSVWGANNTAYGYVIASFILGASIYLGSKRYHASRGIDISLAYKEIPPE